MKRQTLFILSCILLTAQAAIAQSDGVIISKEKAQIEINQEPIDNPIGAVGLDSRLMPYDEGKEHREFFDSTTISSFRLSPLHYGKSTIFPSNRNIFVYLEGERKQFLNLASYDLAYAALGWKINNRLNVTGGLLAVKQFSNLLPYGIDRSGVRFNLNYNVTNQLNFNMWGQYITGSSINSPIDVMLPQTGAGASMVLDLGGGSEIGVGAQYRYDDKKDKGIYQSGGKLKLSF